MNELKKEMVEKKLKNPSPRARKTSTKCRDDNNETIEGRRENHVFRYERNASIASRIYSTSPNGNPWKKSLVIEDHFFGY